jgi:hypothetical protein
MAVRRLGRGWIGIVALSGACGRIEDPGPEAASGASGEHGASGGVAGLGAPSTGGSIQVGASAGAPVTPQGCSSFDASSAVFADQAIDYTMLFRRELYTWTSDEQIAELREGRVLLTRTEREGLGPGYAFEAIAAIARQGDGPMNRVAAHLAGPAFARARYAWPHPWATRMGWPGETYGDNLIRILLREDAWLARVEAGTIRVVDARDRPVPLEAALANPERIALIFFQKDASFGGPVCSGSFSGEGENGYREYIVGNEAMIEEWSIATPAILQKLETDIALLREFLRRIRECPPATDAFYWNRFVSCGWGRADPLSELSAYEEALAMPSEYYLPAPAAIEALIATLEGGVFEPDPLVIQPGG